MNSTNDKFCVILLGMGGPDSLADIKTFLYNIFSDRSIIQLPGGALFQKPFASLISKLRTPKVQAHYKLIGGSSPLLKWTQAQARQIEKIIVKDYPGSRCYVGMRYFKPYINDAIHTAIRDGFNRIIFLPMYPQFSRATTGSSFKVATTILSRTDEVDTVYINDFHDNNKYTKLMTKYIETNICPNDILLFSAHSLPKKFVDVGDPYVEQVKKTASLASNGREHLVSFQSRTGPVEWVGPDTVEIVQRLLSETKSDIFIVPISFVCDHIETLYELDIELKEYIGAPHSKRIHRMPMFNDDICLSQMLAELITDRMFSDARA